MQKCMKSTKDRRRTTSSRAWACLIISACAAAFAPGKAAAQGILCKPVGTETRPMPLQAGTLSVGPDVALGSVVYRQRFDRQAGSYVHCTGHAGRVANRTTRRVELVHPIFYPVYSFDYSLPPLPLSNWNHGPYAGKVYLTNVSGLGVVYTRANTGSPFPQSSVAGAQQCEVTADQRLQTRGCDVSFESNLSFDLLLVKIGDVVPGLVNASSLPTAVIRVSVGDPGLDVSVEPVRLMVPISGSISMLSSTCSTPDVVVPMGSHGLETFTEAQASPWKEFSIRLLGCPGFTGSFTQAGPVWTVQGLGSIGQINNKFPGSFSRSGTTPSTMSFRIDPVSTPIDSARGVLTLDPVRKGGSASASGIGIQISNHAGAPLPLGKVHSSGLSLRSSSQNYSIPLRARYVRSKGVLAPGPATSSATFTIIYN